jgi:dihydrofolate reductase
MTKKHSIDFNIIVACDDAYGIGKNGSIPWHGTSIGKKDMQVFRKLTSESNNKLQPVLIMGRITYNSCGKLPGRIKVMISSDPQNGGFRSVSDAIEHYFDHPIWICGGKNVYLEALSLGPKLIYITKIPGEYDCDTFVEELRDVVHIDPFQQ